MQQGPAPWRHLQWQSEARSQVRCPVSAKRARPSRPIARGRATSPDCRCQGPASVPRTRKRARPAGGRRCAGWSAGRAQPGRGVSCASAMSLTLAHTMWTSSGAARRQRRRVIRGRPADPGRACASRAGLAARPGSRPSARCRRGVTGFRFRPRQRGWKWDGGARRGRENPTQEIGSGRVERVRRGNAGEIRRPGAGLDEFPVLSLGISQGVAGGRLARAKQFVEKDAGQTSAGQRGHGEQGVADIAHGRGSRRDGSYGRASGGVEALFSRKSGGLAPTCTAQDGSPSPPRQAAREHRKFDMRVGVDQSRQQRTLRALLGQRGKRPA